MARYLALTKMWISHECRMVEAGEEFETTFPKGMRLGENLKLLEPHEDNVRGALEVSRQAPKKQ